MWIGQGYNVVCLDLLSQGISIRFSHTPVPYPLPRSEAHHSLFGAHRQSPGIRAASELSWEKKDRRDKVEDEHN